MATVARSLLDAKLVGGRGGNRTAATLDSRAAVHRAG